MLLGPLGILLHSNDLFDTTRRNKISRGHFEVERFLRGLLELMLLFLHIEVLYFMKWFSNSFDAFQLR